MKAAENTFGDYAFPHWVPDSTRNAIIDFWGIWGRTHMDWLKDHKDQGMSDFCHHGPNPNGFPVPPMYALCEYFVRDWELSKAAGDYAYRLVRGIYVHRWNNMGSLIDSEGNDHSVSSCDRWVRVFASETERSVVLSSLRPASVPVVTADFDGPSSIMNIP